MEEGESFEVALKREAIEEIGCHCELRDNVVGKIVEERLNEGLFQTSYCGIADVVKDLGEIQLTENEIAEGYMPPIWVDLNEALALCEADQPKTYDAVFMHERDKLFIKTAIKLLG